MRKITFISEKGGVGKYTLCDGVTALPAGTHVTAATMKLWRSCSAANALGFPDLSISGPFGVHLSRNGSTLSTCSEAPDSLDKHHAT